FTCPECSRALQSKGIYPSAELIEGSGGRVWFCQERYQCPASHAGGKAAKDFRSSDNRLLSQLPICLREQLPYTQSYLSGVETRILNFLLDRRGNALSIAGLSRMVETLQRAEYERAELAYYSACHRHQVLARVVHPNYPPFPPLPPARTPIFWKRLFASFIYAHWGELVSQMCSVGGSILKVDGSKKVAKQILEAGSASWLVTMYNENSEVVKSIFSNDESEVELKRLAVDLMDRYERNQWEPPRVLYVDKDCCQGAS
ncbi:hypothetical protein FOZ63_016854, partial [Perkinsus olseni]